MNESPAGSAEPFAGALRADLDRLVADRQRLWHTPGLSAGIVRDGILRWSVHVGSARLDPPIAAGGSTQFMIGSITKTFTAVVVLALRDEGKLSLDDTLGRWFPESAHAGLPIRLLLAHASGLQREPVGHIWETLDAPDGEALVRGLDDAEQVLASHQLFHYSNLAYGMLGQVIERVEGKAWEDCVRERILQPLGMHRTGTRPGDDCAIGYHVHPYTGVADAEPRFEMGATAPLGGLWSTVEDLTAYAAFVADPTTHPEVLAADTVAQMCRPIILTDPDTWSGGYGLGFGMIRLGERIYVGHGGAMPGFLAGLRVRRPDRLGAVVFCNSTSHADPATLAAELLEIVLTHAPTPAEPWIPEAPLPDLADVTGRWWSEGEELDFYIEGGELWSRLAGDRPIDRTRFVRESPTRFRAVAGRECGEILDLVRDDAGRLVKLFFATYAVTRDPESFEALSSQASG